MGVVLIVIWMLLILPVLIVGAGLGGSLALDWVVGRSNDAGEDEESEEDASGESGG